MSKVEAEKYWSKLDLSYMTEESDDPDNPNGIIEHKIPWRSKSTSETCLVHCMLFTLFFTILELDDFVAILDERLTRTNDSAIGLVAKKVRKIGSPSKSFPPLNAPGWAVDAGSAGMDMSI